MSVRSLPANLCVVELSVTLTFGHFMRHLPQSRGVAFSSGGATGIEAARHGGVAGEKLHRCCRTGEQPVWQASAHSTIRSIDLDKRALIDSR